MENTSPLKRTASTLIGGFLLIFMLWAMGQDSARNRAYRAGQEAIKLENNVSFKFIGECKEHCSNGFTTIEQVGDSLSIEVKIAKSASGAYLIALEGGSQSLPLYRSENLKPGIHQLTISMKALKHAHAKVLQGVDRKVKLYSGLASIHSPPSRGLGVVKYVQSYLE